jgi:hypothetical protein
VATARRYAKLDRQFALDWRCLKKLTPRNYPKRKPVIIGSMRKQVKGHLRAFLRHPGVCAAAVYVYGKWPGRH